LNKKSEKASGKFDEIKNITTFAIHLTNGRVAERLGRGLQNLVQRFESARDLNKASA
jgi:hypothetical protein